MSKVSIYRQSPISIVKTYKLSMGVGNVARRVNKQILIVEFIKIFLFYLTVLFCGSVGDSDLVLKPIGPRSKVWL